MRQGWRGGQELYRPQKEFGLFLEINEKLLKSFHQGNDMAKSGF